MKIVHAADLHLDSPLRGLDQYPEAPVDRIRGATRRAFANLVDLCIQEQVALLLLAGDLFDGDWRDYATGLFFLSQLSRLREAGVAVVMLRGNHDAASQISRHLKLPSNVRELSVQAPETVELPELGVAVHGQGFFERSVTVDLAASYPPPVSGLFNIGMLHTALSGRPGHEPYAPCSLDTLRSKGYDYWALGHVHAREVLCEDPYIVFPGNLQGRHIRETGAKGATVLTVQEGRVLQLEHRPVDVVRFVQCEVDAGRWTELEALLDGVRGELAELVQQADGRLVCVRLTLGKRSELHTRLHRERERVEAEIQALAIDFGGDVWIEKVRLDTSPRIPLQELYRQDDALGQVLAAVAAMRGDEAALAELLALFGDLKGKLPLELRAGAEGVRLDDPAFMEEMLAEVEPLLLARLLGEDA